MHGDGSTSVWTILFMKKSSLKCIISVNVALGNRVNTDFLKEMPCIWEFCNLKRQAYTRCSVLVFA